MARAGFCVLMLSSCGGGGGTSVPVAPPPQSLITSVAPLRALVGTTITVSGMRLEGAVSARVGGGIAPVTVEADTQVRFVLPATASSGPVQLSGANFSVTSGEILEVVVPTLTSSSAATVYVGDVVTLTGTGFEAVTGISFTGSKPVAFERTGPTTIRVTVPPDATSGILSLLGDGFRLDTTVRLEVTTPAVGSTAGGSLTQQLQPGGQFTINGTNLDKVSGFTVNGVSLTVLSRSSGSVTLQVPSQRLSGSLALVVGPYEVPTRVVVDVYLPMSVTSATPTAGSAGAMVRLGGAGLAAATSVSFGAATAPIEARSETELVVRVPLGATTSALQIVGPFETVSGPVFTILAPVSVTGFVVTMNGPNVRLTINGSGLARVSGASIGMTGAVVISQSDTVLVVEAAAAASGAIVLAVANGSPVTAGSYSPALTVTGVDLGQRFMRPSTDAGLRLVRGNAALLRVNMQSSAPNTPSPPITVSAEIGGSVHGPIPLMGPETVPTGINPYDRNSGYSVRVPETWIVPGVTLRVVVGGASPSQIAFAPTVSGSTKLDVVMVPMIVNNTTPVMPSATEARVQIARVFPLAPQTLTVTTRAPMTLAGAGALSSGNWSRALQSLNALRLAEAPGKLYYGVVPASARLDAIAGLGYVNTIGNMTNSYLASLGFDASYVLAQSDPFGFTFQAWANVMLHEIGHNLSRAHAPCGGTPGPDPSYPYAGGLLGDLPLYDDASGLLSGPFFGAVSSRMADVMGYCGGNFFSDYNYEAVRDYLERLTALANSGQAPAPAEGYLQLMGVIQNDSVEFAPATVLQVPATLQASGSHEVRVTTLTGATRSAYFTPTNEPDQPAAIRAFVVAMPNPGELASVSVWEGTKRLQLQNAGNVNAALAFRWSEDAGRLTVRWNAESLPNLTAFHVSSGGARTTLGVNMTGPSSVMDTSALPAGGSFDLVFSDSIAVRRMVVNR